MSISLFSGVLAIFSHDHMSVHSSKHMCVVSIIYKLAGHNYLLPSVFVLHIFFY